MTTCFAMGLAMVLFASGCVTRATVGYAAGHGCDLPGGARVEEADKIPHPAAWPLVPFAAVVDIVLTPIYIPLGVQWIGWWIEEQKPWTPQEVGNSALILANEKAQTLFNCKPFYECPPAQFVEGHWTWHCLQPQGQGPNSRAQRQGDFEATVEFEAKYLKHPAKCPKPKVSVVLLDSRGCPKPPPP